MLCEVGFEPTHPKILEPKSSALDRSAIRTPYMIGRTFKWSNITLAFLEPHHLCAQRLAARCQDGAFSEVTQHTLICLT